MPPAALGDQFDVQVALLPDRQQGNRPGETGEVPADDRAPLVEHEVEAHPARREQSGHRGRPLDAADLLVVADGQVQGDVGAEPVGEQALHRLEERDHRPLVVGGASPPQVLAVALAGERRMLPISLGARLDPHHVHVAHEQHRRGGRVGALPGVEERVPGHHFAPQLLVHQRVRALQEGAELVEGSPVDQGAVLLADSGDPHRLGQVVEQRLPHARQDRRLRRGRGSPHCPAPPQRRRSSRAHPGACNQLHPLLPGRHA